MNKQNINKIKLFFMGLESRFNDNSSIFKEIDVVFKAGLKSFKGTGVYENGKIKFNFNGKTETLSFNQLAAKLVTECENYDEISFLYRERGTDIIITGDNKNVKMKNVENKIQSEEKSSSHKNTTSTLLNRDYYIKVGKADALLKEIGIMTSEGKIKNNMIRKYNQIDHYVELLEGILDELPKDKPITLLDCGCGKSYLSFVLNYYLTEVKRRKCNFIGLDYSEQVIKASREMASNLGYRNMEFHAVDIKDYKPEKQINIVISLHACDTATDLALALGIKVEADVIIAVPCCHRELLSQYSYEPFKDILKHGVFKTRLADVLTDGMRSLMLEAKGYEVSVVEYISPLETPKNLMIRAVKRSEENDEAMNSYLSLMSNLNAFPALYAYLNDWQ